MLKAVHACGLLVAALVLAHPARAEQLDADACAKLKTLQSDLEKDGVRSSMERGPDWAKVNLPPAKLDRIRTLIETDEQILFRCPHAKPLIELAPEEPEAPAKPAKSAEKPSGTDKQGAAKPAAKKAAKPAPKPKSAAVEAPATEAAPAKRQAAKPKPKVDDAYRPPAPASQGTNPFEASNGPPPKQ
jgi:hypothetical protein